MTQILDYLFRSPGSNWSAAPFAFTFAIVFLLVGVAIYAYVKYGNPHVAEKKLWGRLPKKFYFWGLLAGFLTWFRTENVAYLSSRFWWLIYMAVLGAVVYFEVRFFLREKEVRHAKLKRSKSVKVSGNKYIPRPKAKKK